MELTSFILAVIDPSIRVAGKSLGNKGIINIATIEIVNNIMESYEKVINDKSFKIIPYGCVCDSRGYVDKVGTWDLTNDIVSIVFNNKGESIEYIRFFIDKASELDLDNFVLVGDNGEINNLRDIVKISKTLFIDSKNYIEYSTYDNYRLVFRKEKDNGFVLYIDRIHKRGRPRKKK